MSNTHAALVEALTDICETMEKLSDASDRDVTPYIWNKYECSAKLQWARAALAQAALARPAPVAVADDAEALAAFTEYMEANYPNGTIISDPAWHAPRLFRIAKRHLRAAPTHTPAATDAGAAQPLTDAALLKIAREEAGGTVIKLTRDVGPYEVTEPTHVYRLIARAIERAHGIGAQVSAAEQAEAPR